MNIILNPMISFMEKMNFKKRFILISLLIFGSLMIISWIYISSKVEERYYLVNETAPAKLYEPIQDMIQNLMLSRDLHAQASGKVPDPALAAKIAEVDNNVDLALTKMKSIKINADQINQMISTLDMNWKQLKPELDHFSQVQFDRNQQLIDSTTDLLEYVSDDSDLSLDTDPTTTNLIEIFTKFNPQVANKTNLMRSLGVDILTHKQASPQMRERLNYDLALFERNNDNLVSSIHRLVDLDPNYAKIFGTVLNDIEKNNTATIVKRYILDTNNYDASPVEYANILNKFLQDYNTISDIAYKAFNERVAYRLNKLDYQIVTTASGLTIVFVIICLMFVAFYKSTDLAVQKLITNANAIAEGNLSNFVTEQRSDEFGLIMSAIANMRNRISEIIQQIKNTSNIVGRGASEISQGNLDLSKRTEQQASSLASTAASMEELSITVKENAKQSQKAAELAEHARKQADASGTVVNEAVTAMSQINDSSNKIAEISGVIDDIAFQTNLLALNAAIEAARAGEQGRGFAVVAQEVRNLAQRSSTAAKEISALINDSVEKITRGADLVTKSGDALHEIVKSAGSVSDLVGSIATATTQQSKGLEEINKAITQMDGITQQNAALVEETAAAGENVNQQVRNLIKQIEFFRDPNVPQVNYVAEPTQITHNLAIDPVTGKVATPQQSTEQGNVQMPPRRGQSDHDWAEF